MNEFRYDSDLVGGSLMVRESRVIADLLLANATPEDWDVAIRVDNRLQKRSPSSAKRNAQAIRKRLERLESPFWRALRDGDEELATQVAFSASLERNLLLVEFIETVVADTYAIHAEAISPYQWMEFIDERAQRDASITDWKESSRRKMGQVAFRMLAEAGYLKSTRSGKLQNVIVRPELKELLEDSSRIRIKRCMEVSQRAA
ncbi:DUF1819 family protein [Thalassolituus oleivorans]|jgi:hypothetical protein|uniref:DUF1819 family protein n=1 Tax=Thalassolituus oleivorans TaxID=187493 RepID=UPI0023F00F13|nr:DUF1819 family protein [Thalassolituus oleivorans]